MNSKSLGRGDSQEEFADMKTGFCNKFHLYTGLVNQIVDRLVRFCAKILCKLRNALVPVGVALQQTLSTPFQLEQLLCWEFHVTVRALPSWNHQFTLEKPEDVLEKRVRALVFLLLAEILL